MKFDLFKILEPVPNQKLKNRILNSALSWAIPFNKGLGIEIITLHPGQVCVRSRPVRRRQNHVGGAHACFLALMGEYPAGLCLAQNFSPKQFRMIIGRLEVEYHKQGRGILTATSLRPETLPSGAEDEFWVPMRTEIINEKGERVAECKTEWQLKRWEAVGKSS